MSEVATSASEARGQLSEPLLRASKVSKAFNGVYALKDVDFDLRAGEVHALLGPNGAGKSTLIKILNGVLEQDEGTVTVGGNERRTADIATVFQELSLVPALTVAQNIFLGNELTSGLGITRKMAMARETEDLMGRLGLTIGANELVEDLSVASRQLVEIAKAIHRNASVLVLDEPTATLTKADQMHLFSSVRDIQKSGVGILYVTHRLTEVFELADRVTVIRDGRRVLTAPVGDLDMKSLVDEISGENLSIGSGPSREAFDAYVQPDRELDRGETIKLRISDLAGDRFSGISFDVAPGEIVGIAGLIGTGRSELLETIAGARRATSGEIELNGRAVAFRNPWDGLASGVALVPEDRHRSGLVLQHSVQQNLALAHHRAIKRHGLIDGASLKNLVRSLVDTLQIKTASPGTLVQNLSGGNQQKVVFAKWLQPGIQVLLLDEPTQGVDVKARQEIYRVIRRFADEGAAVVVVSSDFVELQEISHQLYFMTSTSMSEPEIVTSGVTDQYIYSKLNERGLESHD
jgi:ribose transport system ATP-binding protein